MAEIFWNAFIAIIFERQNHWREMVRLYKRSRAHGSFGLVVEDVRGSIDSRGIVVLAVH